MGECWEGVDTAMRSKGTVTRDVLPHSEGGGQPSEERSHAAGWYLRLTEEVCRAGKKAKRNHWT